MTGSDREILEAVGAERARLQSRSVARKQQSRRPRLPQVLVLRFGGRVRRQGRGSLARSSKSASGDPDPGPKQEFAAAAGSLAAAGPFATSNNNGLAGPTRVKWQITAALASARRSVYAEGAAPWKN